MVGGLGNSGGYRPSQLKTEQCPEGCTLSIVFPKRLLPDYERDPPHTLQTTCSTAAPPSSRRYRSGAHWSQEDSGRGSSSHPVGTWHVIAGSHVGFQPCSARCLVPTFFSMRERFLGQLVFGFCSDQTTHPPGKTNRSRTVTKETPSQVPRHFPFHHMHPLTCGKSHLRPMRLQPFPSAARSE